MPKKMSFDACLSQMTAEDLYLKLSVEQQRELMVVLVRGMMFADEHAMLDRMIASARPAHGGRRRRWRHPASLVVHVFCEGMKEWDKHVHVTD